MILIIFINNTQATPHNCIIINKVILKGDDYLSSKRKKAVLSKYEGRCINGNDISELIHELTNGFTAKGYITTKITIPEQQAKDGLLLLETTQGQVEDIEYEDNSNRLFDTIFYNTKGKSVNLRDIEQAFEHLNNLKSNNVKIELKPASKPGHSIISVKNTPRKRWLVNVGIDNNMLEV